MENTALNSESADKLFIKIGRIFIFRSFYYKNILYITSVKFEKDTIN